MMRLLRELDARRYAPVSYVVAETDTTSIPRLRDYIRREERQEEERRKEGGGRDEWEGRYPRVGDAEDDRRGRGAMAAVHRLPRAREVHQSYLAAVPATLRALLATVALVRRVRPDLVLANGPGTCVPVAYAAFLLRLLAGPGGGCRVVFVESACRVATLSLSGRLVYPIVDRFVVHWPGLRERYPLVEVSDVFVRHDENARADDGCGGVVG